MVDNHRRKISSHMKRFPVKFEIMSIYKVKNMRKISNSFHWTPIEGSSI